MKKCPRCNKQLNDKTNSCHDCGFQFSPLPLEYQPSSPRPRNKEKNFPSLTIQNILRPNEKVIYYKNVSPFIYKLFGVVRYEICLTDTRIIVTTGSFFGFEKEMQDAYYDKIGGISIKSKWLFWQLILAFIIILLFNPLSFLSYLSIISDIIGTRIDVYALTLCSIPGIFFSIIAIYLFITAKKSVFKVLGGSKIEVPLEKVYYSEITTDVMRIIHEKREELDKKSIIKDESLNRKLVNTENITDNELIKMLEMRLIKGEISEDTYQKLKEKYMGPKFPKPQAPPQYTPPKIVPKPISQVTSKLILPSDREINITEKVQRFGRDDLLGAVSEEYAGYITRTEGHRYHFAIHQINNEFYIQDENSSNGTLLNRRDIRGQGYVKLNDGDIISPASVCDIRFVIGEQLWR